MATKKPKKKPPRGAEIIGHDSDPARVHDLFSRMLMYLAKHMGDPEPRNGTMVNVDLTDLMRRVGAALEERAILLTENDHLRAAVAALGAENDRLRTPEAKSHEKENTRRQAHPEKNKY